MTDNMSIGSIIQEIHKLGYKTALSCDQSSLEIKVENLPDDPEKNENLSKLINRVVALNLIVCIADMVILPENRNDLSSGKFDPDPS